MLVKPHSIKLNFYRQFKNSINKGLEGTLEKQSPIDGINHIYSKTSRIKALPKYLTVQLVRFFWKKADADDPGASAAKAKILRVILSF